MEVLAILSIIVLFILAAVFYVLMRSALSRNDEFETANADLSQKVMQAYAANDNYDAWFQEFKTRVVDAYQRIRLIDASGHFEADDEVGYFFKELKTLIERLHELGIMDEIEKSEATQDVQKSITTEELTEVLEKRRQINPRAISSKSNSSPQEK